MIRKDELTYHVSVDPIFMYGLNSLLGKEFQSLTMNGKMGFHNIYGWRMLFPYFMQRIRSPKNKFSSCSYFTPCGSKHILVTAPNYRDTSYFLFG